MSRLAPRSTRSASSSFSIGVASLLVAAAMSVPLAPAHGQSSFDLDDLAFMTGHWTRTTDGMHVEQVFLPPTAGTVVGMQRRTQDGDTLVSYFFVIERTDEGIVCRFKHFENDYTTYEDRNSEGPRTFWLVDTGMDSATFEERAANGRLHLRYRLTDQGRLGIAVGSPEDFESGTFVESLHDRVH